MGAPITLDLGKVVEDVYIGRGEGNPPILTRLSLIEKEQANINARFDKIEAMLAKIAWGLFGTFCAVASEIILRIVLK